MIWDKNNVRIFSVMAKTSSSINTDFIISFFLPEGMIDWFEVVNIKEEPNKGTAQADVLYNSVLHIYLDERDTRNGEEMGLNPNGFTEATLIKDYPIRTRKVLLHVRRRRYLDADNRNVILNQYQIASDGTKLSVEFVFFKGSEVERYYKHHLSDFETWSQRNMQQTGSCKPKIWILAVA